MTRHKVRCKTPLNQPDNTYLECSPYASDRGQKIGKIPRNISLRDLNDLDHPRTPLKAIRSKCLDCCQGSKSEVRKCVVYKCPLFVMRMGSNPLHGKPLTPQEKTPDAFDGESEVLKISRSEEIHDDN